MSIHLVERKCYIHFEMTTIVKIMNSLICSPIQRQNYIDVATGSLGQGLSIAAGMAYCGKYFDKARYGPNSPVLEILYE